jgi:hypothetical protein|tara:strand:- start:1811 stop:2104 length:294 start_codon:yes stop_codon:yes gene_type:complete
MPPFAILNIRRSYTPGILNPFLKQLAYLFCASIRPKKARSRTGDLLEQRWCRRLGGDLRTDRRLTGRRTFENIAQPGQTGLWLIQLALLVLEVGIQS